MNQCICKIRTSTIAEFPDYKIPLTQLKEVRGYARYATI